jgi:hypothetical protein
MKAWAEARDKELLVLLSYPEPQVRAACEGSDRDSTEMLDWHPKSLRTHMTEAGIRWFDTLPAHEADFRKFGLNPAEYTARYYIGHYNPTGNHFFAYAIKDELVDWLDPKPPTYRGDDEALIRFRGYLPG